MRCVYRYIILLAFALLLFSVVLFTNIRYDEPMQYLFYRPSFVHVIQDLQTSATNGDCRFHSCFNIFRCKPTRDWKIKVFVYPITHFQYQNKTIIDDKLSYEYESMLLAIQNSGYVTTNSSDACMFISPIDTLSSRNPENISVALHSLPSWRGGQNHLIFNMFPVEPMFKKAGLSSFEFGNAMLASSNILLNTNRQGFDISMPVFNSLTVRDPEYHTISISGSRKWKLIISQLSIDMSQRNILRKVEDNEESVLMLRRCLGTTYDSIAPRKLCKDGLPFQYPEILKDGIFCLILPSVYYGTTTLLDVMMMGCIPVIAMDDYVLPFHDILDWNRAAVIMRQHQLADIVKILNRFSPIEIREKRYQTFFFWKKYFSSIKNIMDTVLGIYNERVFVNTKKSYQEWNGPFGKLDGNERKPGAVPPLFYPLSPAKSDEGFTAIILTYNRVEMLFNLMKQLDNVPSLSKVVVVWNNPYADPQENDWPALLRPWKLIRTKTNRLTNRFYPFKEIETEAVMAIDDDILMLTSDEIEFAYQTWREFPDRLVGFPPRVHVSDSKELINGKRLKYKYESEWQNELSMVLTGAAFYHKMYNHWFTYMLPFKTKDYIDEKMNCEDISMNFLIANLTGKPPIKVSPRKRFKCSQCNGNDSLWSESSHFMKRSECLSVFTEHFGKMPLEPIEFRVDPVLFQEAVPHEMKAFPDLGTV